MTAFDRDDEYDPYGVAWTGSAVVGRGVQTPSRGEVEGELKELVQVARALMVQLQRLVNKLELGVPEEGE